MFDSEVVKYFLGLGTALVGGLGGLLYKGTHARIRRVEEKVETKADAEELNRQRGHVAELFDRVSEVRETMATRTDIKDLRDLIIERLPSGR